MAHNLNDLEPTKTRFGAPSQDYPLGSFINGTAEGKRNGSYAKAEWANDIWGFFGALFRNAGITPNGKTETARDSQLFTALINVFDKIKAKGVVHYDINQELTDEEKSIARKNIDVPNISDDVKQFASVADMKAAKFLAPGMTVVTQGYYEPGDGGGAVYVVRKKTDEDKDNTGAIHFLQDGICAKLIIESVVSVKWFGAKGDGRTDDTEAIQRAIDYLFTAGNSGTITVPLGTFIFTSICVKTGLTFKGDGGTLKLKENTCVESSANYYLIHNTGYSNVIYENLIIDGNRGVNNQFKVADAITAVGPETIVRGCKIYNAPDSGIMFSDAPGGRCIDNFIDTGGDVGIYMNAPEVIPARGDMVCSGNIVKNFPYGGVALKRSIENCLVYGNMIIDCGNGITVEDFGVGNGGAPDHLLIAGNLLKNIGFTFRGVPAVSEVGIALNGCTNVVVNNNKIQNVSGDGIVLSGTCDSSIQNNHLIGYKDSPSPSGSRGCISSVRNGVTPSRNIISGNTILEFNEFGVNLAASMNSVLEANHIQAKKIALSIAAACDSNTISNNYLDGEVVDVEKYSGNNSNAFIYNFLVHAKTSWQQNGHLLYTGLSTPVGTVSPWFPGQLCMTTVGGRRVFIGYGSTNTEWLQISGPEVVDSTITVTNNA